MEYSVHKLSKMSGVSARTLRYYDEIGLLKPTRIASSGYRIYGKPEVDTLQQILFYRELAFPLDRIKTLLNASDFDRAAALASHLDLLQAKRKRLDALIINVTKTIAAVKGETTMTDQEKFEGFKQKQIDDNERQFGKEIRAKYGDDRVDRSYAKIKGMTEEQYAQAEELSRELNDTLKAAFEQGDPASETAQKACRLHKEWLCCYWDGYCKEAHLNVTQMYVDDERFKAYYDKIKPGCAVFLRDAVKIFTLMIT